MGRHGESQRQSIGVPPAAVGWGLLLQIAHFLCASPTFADFEFLWGGVGDGGSQNAKSRPHILWFYYPAGMVSVTSFLAARRFLRAFSRLALFKNAIDPLLSQTFYPRVHRVGRHTEVSDPSVRERHAQIWRFWLFCAKVGQTQVNISLGAMNECGVRKPRRILRKRSGHRPMSPRL